MNLCFAKCEKVIFWGGPFFQIWLMFKKHCKRVFQHIKKQKCILRGYYLVQVGVIIWSKLGAFYKRKLGPDNNLWICCVQLFYSKMCWNPYCIVFWQTVFWRSKLGPDNNPQKAKLGPDNNSTAHIYLYIAAHLDWWAVLRLWDL